MGWNGVQIGLGGGGGGGQGGEEGRKSGWKIDLVQFGLVCVVAADQEKGERDRICSVQSGRRRGGH